MAKKLSCTRAKRGGNRTVMTKLMNEADGLLKTEPSDKKRLKAIATNSITCIHCWRDRQQEQFKG